MTAFDAYGGAFFCLREAREAVDGLDCIDWLLKAEKWRALARRIRWNEAMKRAAREAENELRRVS